MSDSKNRITTASGIYYDAAGNVINDSFHTYTYDAENRMITVDGSSQVFFYDALGRRTQTIYGGNTYSNIFGLNGRVEVQFTGTIWSRSDLYIGSVGAHLGSYANGTTYFSHTDQVGTEVMHTGPTGSVLGTCKGLPFGDGWSCSGTTGTDSNYTGQTYDIQSGLTQFPNRYLSTTEGRWMHPDPAGLTAVDPTNPQTWNRYAYVTNNPVSYVDPSGLLLTFAQFEAGCDLGACDGSFGIVNPMLADRADRAEAAWLGSGSISYYTVQGGNLLLRTGYVFVPNYCPSGSQCPEDNLGTFVPVYVNLGSVRGPDFISFNINVGIPWLANLVGPTFAVNLDRNGNLYVGGGVNVGKAATLVSGSVTADWLTQSATPNASQLNGFLTKNSFNVTAGYYVGAQGTWTPGSGFALGGGFVSPQAGGAWTYSWNVGNVGIGW